LRKTPILLAALACLTLAPRLASSAVYISELCDPHQNFANDRFIEIYNNGPGPVDLTGWQLQALANFNINPGVNPVQVWNLSGTIAEGQALVAGDDAPIAPFTVNFVAAAWSTNDANWNGGNAGDGAKLLNASAVLVDYVYQTVPYFVDADYVRKPTVIVGNPAYDPNEWTSTPVELATNASPGSHNGSVPPPAGPFITNVVTDPASPIAGTPVDVQASVVDTTGPITSVSVTWGITSGSQPNTIAMTLQSGSTYRTTSAIPSQAAGATVYYQVHATGNSGTSQSSLQSYTLPGGGGAPLVLAVGEMSDSTLLVSFNEPVQQSSAEVPTNYTIDALTGVAAVRDPLNTSRVLVTMRNIPQGLHTMVVSGVADLDGNVATGDTCTFFYVDVSIPAGYYNSAEGLTGTALRSALKQIIDNHNAQSYSYALVAFRYTDVKPNGKVWDMYSDVPGGNPPYEYTFGQTGGSGSTEGTGYNREHSFPDSWFNGNSPMHSDLWILYPTDIRVNGYRANYPYGVVGTPTTISQNGSKLGTQSGSYGYSGTVFEPIDAYKGDLARGTFYVCTRYFGEDGGWTGSPAMSGANPQPWAAALYSDWSAADPVAWKERLRNGAIYLIQGNRNPFVDHPEWVALIYDSASVAGVGEGPARVARLGINSPNPFGASTTLRFELTRSERVSLRVFDVGGRLVKTLAQGATMEAGSHEMTWDGRSDSGAALEAGLYFCRLDAGVVSETRRLVHAR
jgi:endonuclease I